MVNAEMFKGAFQTGNTNLSSNVLAPKTTKPQYEEDPEVAKLRLFMLKWLSILIGGAAILLIVWRIILKFF